MKPPISLMVALVIDQANSRVELECEFLWEDGTTLRKRVPAHRPMRFDLQELWEEKPTAKTSDAAE